jgi:hypothetical protein
MKRIVIAAVAALTVLTSTLSAPRLAYADQTVTTEPPAQSSASATVDEPCPKGKRGGAIGGIVVGSVFWWVLPMSIPVLITQAKKLKAHNRAMQERRCQYAPGR